MSSNSMRFNLGCIFYRNVHGNIYTYRVIDIDKDTRTYTLIKDGDPKNTFTYSEMYLSGSTMTRLIAPASIAINIVNTEGNLKDVICMVFLSGSTDPVAVCRQNAIDVFETLANPESPITKVGLSVNNITCPCDYGALFSYESVVKNSGVLIDVYYDDTIEDILNDICGLEKYDEALTETYNHVMNPANNFMTTVGWHDNLKEFLVDTDFLMDIHAVLGIMEVKYDIAEMNEDVNSNLAEDIWHHTGKRPTTIYVTPYDRSINLNEFQRDYNLVYSRETKKLYIVGYDIKSETVPRDSITADKEAKLKELGFNVL